MLTIKDSGRYANYLASLIERVENLMYYKDNYIKTTETHFKSKGNPADKDEIIENEVDRLFTGQIQDMAYLAQELIQEKLRLALAIEKAKKELQLGWTEDGIELTLDTAYEYNKNLRNLMSDSYVGRTLNVKPTLKKGSGRAYMINGEGNQVAYNYDVEIKTELDFNKDVIKKLSKKTLDKADKISTLIDQAELKEIVDFEPTYSVRDSLEDVIALYESKLANK
jgi:hypothetical protein